MILNNYINSMIIVLENKINKDIKNNYLNIYNSY